MIIENLVDDEDRLVDPRRARSRARLLDAATSLLSTGGIEAVTIDAVTKVSKVARTTLYRHFTDSTQLLAAAFERLLPPVTAPPASGTIREQLIELLDRQAKLIEEAPPPTDNARLARPRVHPTRHRRDDIASRR